MGYRLFTISIIILIFSCSKKEQEREIILPKFKLVESERFIFNSFVDCNMAEVWVGDTLRIFPGKYGEDPVWGDAEELEYADGLNPDEVFLRKPDEFVDPKMPPNVPPGEEGLHGAVWFETVYQDTKDASGKTLYALYHNENYPATLPYDPTSGKGYVDENWPEGLRGPTSAAAVPRIGIMASTDGGKSWENNGILLEDLQPRMILKPQNTSLTFAGGVGDPSAVASGDHLYVFYGEYSYPIKYDSVNYDPSVEWSGQCISIARIALADLDNPQGKAKRWGGKAFDVAFDEAGTPVRSLQIPEQEGGGAASIVNKQFHWGPSVSWNTYLNCWVMLMGRVEGKKWEGSNLYISFNLNQDLGDGDNSQQWSKPQLLVSRPGRILWYPSLQPLNTPEDIKSKYTCVRLGKKARLFFKEMEGQRSEYLSECIVEFDK